MRRYGDDSGEGKGHIGRNATCPLTEGIFHLMVSWPHNWYQNIFLIKKKWKKKRSNIQNQKVIISLFTSSLEMTEFELPVSMNLIYRDWID